MAHDAQAAYSPNSATEAELAALTIEVEGEIVKWTCPRCHFEFSERVEIDRPVYGFDLETVGSGPDEGMLDLTCACGTKHSGQDKPSCGFAALQPVKRAGQDQA